MPNRIFAVPLLHEEEALGVLEVLDPPAGRRDPLADMELLSLFASQAAAALALLRRARRAKTALAGEEGPAALVARIAGLLERREDQSSIRLLEALAEVLERQ